MGLGMLLLLGRLTGLVLLAGKRLWVGDVGDFTGSAVLGRDERFSGCAAASSYKFTINNYFFLNEAHYHLVSHSYFIPQRQCHILLR